MCNNSAKSSGFTLVELMITVVIAGILVAVGIPSFNSTINSSRLTSYANELVTALNLARSEAVKRGMQVSIRRNGNTKRNWDSGWIIFTDANGDGVLDDNGNEVLCEPPDDNGNIIDADCLLRAYPALTNGYTLRTGNNYACWVAFDSVGLIKVSGNSCTGGNVLNDTFRLCDSSKNKTTALSIALNVIGRARVYVGTSACP
jgi:type IV fimbrial biogenesis protein FimT